MSEETLQQAVDTAVAKYQERAQLAAAGELSILSNIVKEAKSNLSKFLAIGADPCPMCGELPHGMVVRSTQDGKVYEVGCLGCKPLVYDKEGSLATDKTPAHERTRVSFSARGYLPTTAVENWNKQLYLRDKKF